MLINKIIIFLGVVMTKMMLPIVGLIISIVTSTICYSQEWIPVILNERGDTLDYVYPPPR